MRALATVLTAVAVVSLALGVMTFCGIGPMRAIATPSGFLRLADTLLLLTIALLLNEVATRKTQRG